ncbi:MAG: hypothetical protein EHM48_03805 [Planctomycetaceae bacterium]|nr:MAG: hypothetical protein EHM48_03805 [Planctomycetaceae bacterium]
MDISWLTNMWESNAVMRAIVWLAGLLVVLTILGIALMKFRRKYLAKDAESDEAGFSIESLEKMKKAGNISDEEFRRLRRAALGLDFPAGKTDNTGLTSAPKQADEDNGTSRA